MMTTADILRTVQSIADPTVDRAMAAALPSADPAAMRVLALMLLQRKHPDGTVALIVHYHRLSAEIQQTIIEHANELFRPLRQAITRRNTEGPANAIRIIQASLSTRLAYLAGDQLRHGPNHLRNQAATCLLHMAQSCASDPRPGHPCMFDPEGAAYLQSAVEEAVALYVNHEHKAVLLALATLMPRPLRQAQAVLAEPRHPASEPLRSLMTQASDSAIRRALPVLLAVPGMANAAIDGLRQCAATGRLGDALAGYHLLLPWPARRPLSALRAAETLWPSRASVHAMSPHQSRGLAEWAMALSFDRPTRIARLVELADVPDESTRLFALRRLLKLAHEDPGGAVNDAIAEYTRDADVAIIRIALWHLIRIKYAGLASILATLVNSPHDDLRRIATDHLAPLGFARLWDQWPDLSRSQRLAAGRALIKIEPNFHRALSDKMLPGNQKARLRALAMIHELNQGAFFESALVRLSRDDDEVIASSAVKALGSAAGEQAVASVEQALAHDDSRVRANAVEAMTQLQSTRHASKLVEMAEHEDNRPRANAIAALMDMRTADAMRALGKMLEDERPNHRGSALWLVEKMGVIELARHVAELSITDPDAQVRTRADRVIQEMIRSMSSSGSGAAERSPRPSAA